MIVCRVSFKVSHEGATLLFRAVDTLGLAINDVLKWMLAIHPNELTHHYSRIASGSMEI